VPGFVIKGFFGEMGEEVLLKGSFVVPGKLQENGFAFLEPEIEGALRWEMGIPDAEGPD
jgi:NAD dependent epimerase/dehydratase family enzyme